MNQSQSQFQIIAAKLREGTQFIVSAHIRADGDAIASVCFVTSLLERLGKTVIPVLHDSVPDQKYSFLQSFSKIRHVQTCPAPKNATLVLLDTPNTERMGDVAKWIQQPVEIINIDHHISNIGFGYLDFIDPEASSTCEILMKLWEPFSELMDSRCAEILYTGICFDTGRFRFSNTTAETLRIAARLVHEGARPDYISEIVFYNWSLIHARTIGRALNSLQVHKRGKVVTLLLDNEFFESNPEGWKEVEGISDLGTSIAGIDIALFFKEIEPSRFKVSLRAVDEWDVGRIASVFGGGGHIKAAGCELTGTFDEVCKRLLAEIDLPD